MLKEISWVVLLILLGFSLLYCFQRFFIYIPDKRKPTLSEYKASDMEEVSLKTSDGLLLFAWYKPAQLDKPTLLYFHGNAGHIGNRMPIARELIKSGYGVLLLEYRGYGGNPGRPSEKGLYEDAEAGMRFLLARGVKAKQVVIFGESIGSAVASYLAPEYPVCGVILQAPFTSLADLVHYHYPWMFISLWDKYDSLGRIDRLHAPLLILHGQQDNIVPYRFGEQLFKKALEPKKMISFSDRGHNDMWDIRYYEQVVDFMKAHCS